MRHAAGVYPGAHAATHADKAAIVMADTGETVTYAELDERSRRLAHAMRDHGLVRGDCVAVLAENDPRYFEIYWAAMRSGFYFTTLNTSLGDR